MQQSPCRTYCKPRRRLSNSHVLIVHSPSMYSGQKPKNNPKVWVKRRCFSPLYVVSCGPVVFCSFYSSVGSQRQKRSNLLTREFDSKEIGISRKVVEKSFLFCFWWNAPIDLSHLKSYNSYNVDLRLFVLLTYGRLLKTNGIISANLFVAVVVVLRP